MCTYKYIHISRPYLQCATPTTEREYSAKSVIMCTHNVKRLHLQKLLLPEHPDPKANNGNEPTAQTRRKCVHTTISLCRHYPEEFWFVLVTCSAINHSHAWPISPCRSVPFTRYVCLFLACSVYHIVVCFVSQCVFVRLYVRGACPALMSSCLHIDVVPFLVESFQRLKT